MVKPLASKMLYRVQWRNQEWTTLATSRFAAMAWFLRLRPVAWEDIRTEGTAAVKCRLWGPVK